MIYYNFLQYKLKVDAKDTYGKWSKNAFLVTREKACSTLQSFIKKPFITKLGLNGRCPIPPVYSQQITTLINRTVLTGHFVSFESVSRVRFSIFTKKKKKKLHKFVVDHSFTTQLPILFYNFRFQYYIRHSYSSATIFWRSLRDLKQFLFILGTLLTQTDTYCFDFFNF